MKNAIFLKGWSNIELGELCDLQNGFAFKSKDYIANSNTLSCRMSNIRPDGKFDINYNPRFLPEDFTTKYNKFLLRDGDVIIAMTDMATEPKILGVPTIVRCEGKNVLLNQRVGKLVIINEKKVYFPYLQQVLNRKQVRMYYTRFAGGGVQINLGKQDLLSIPIPLPPLAEQKHIAAILDKADTIRHKRQAAIKLADSFLRATFLDMFGDPVTNPKGWEWGTIRELVSEVKYGTSQKADISEGNYPILRMNNITYGGRLDISALKYINLTEADEAKYLAQKGDLLFNRTNSKELVGKTAVYNLDYPMAIAGYLIRVRANKIANSHYISGYLNSTHGKQTLLGMCKSIIGMANINAQELQDIKILKPPPELQIEYAQMVYAVEAKKLKLIDAIKHGKRLFNSLTQRAFRGEL